ncbi:MAG: O-antigen ligase family protein [Deltaproteobacteria bacterium]
MQNILSEIFSASAKRSVEIMDKLIAFFLVLSIALPAYIFIVYLIFDAFYWKANALYVCVAALLILGIIRIFISKEKPDVKQIYSIMPVIVYMTAVVISTLLSPYAGKAIWGQMFFHEGMLTLLCYGAVFIAARLFIKNETRLNIVIYSTWITAIIIIIDSIMRYDIRSHLNFFEIAFYALIFILFKYLAEKEGKYSKAFKYIWISALVLFFDAALRSCITNRDVAFYINDGATFCHRNYLASYFTLIFLPAVASYFFSEKKKTNLLFYILSCIFFSMFILNHTRSAWVGNAAGFVLLIILGRKKITLKKLSALLISFIIIVFAVNTYSQGLIFTRFNTMVNDAAKLTDKDSDKTYVGTTRFKIWELSVPLIPKYFWFGAGPDMFERIFPQKEFTKSVSAEYRGIAANAHNEYLNLILNIGIFGLLAYVWLILSILKNYLGFYRKYGVDKKNLYLMLGLFCAWCAYLVQAFFNNSVVSTSPTLWAVMGILSAAPHYKEFVQASNNYLSERGEGND